MRYDYRDSGPFVGEQVFEFGSAVPQSGVLQVSYAFWNIIEDGLSSGYSARLEYEDPLGNTQTINDISGLSGAIPGFVWAASQTIVKKENGFVRLVLEKVDLVASTIHTFDVNILIA